MRIVVTGSSGCIGSALVPKLRAAGHEVAEVDVVAGGTLPADGAYDVFCNLAWQGSRGERRADYALQLGMVETALDYYNLALRLGCRRFLCPGTVGELMAELLECSGIRAQNLVYINAKSTLRRMLRAIERPERCRAVGRIVSRNHSLGGATFDRTYAYDDLDRLAADGGVAYTYDAAGNRMTRTENGETITYTLGVGDRLASYGRAASPLAAGGGSYTHNAAGCVTRIERDGRPTLDLTWDSQYRLLSVSTNGAFAESYAYDALGRRVSTTTLEGTVRHVYDDSWQCLADIDENGNVRCSYVWGDGIDNLLAVKIGSETYTALTDIQGTVWGFTDSTGVIVARWTYDAWGNVLSEDVTTPALATIRYRFQGREWSKATGLINFRMRWYDAETGRWLSKDPIGLGGGLNLYVFCGNEPIINTDPDGNDTYVLDKHKHGGPHIDRYRGNHNIGRYTPKGAPIPHKGRMPPPIPRSDWMKFISAAEKLTSVFAIAMSVTAFGDSEIHPGMPMPGPPPPSSPPMSPCEDPPLIFFR